MSQSLRIAIKFVIGFVVLQQVWIALQGTWFHQWLIHRMTVGCAANLLNLFQTEVRVSAIGPRLVAPGGGLRVMSGCDGMEVWLLFAAAIFSGVLTWKQRLVGLALGTFLIFSLNQARLLILFWAVRNDRWWFDQIHGVVGPLFMIFAVLGFMLLLQRSREPQHVSS